MRNDNSPLIRRSEPKPIHRHFLDVVLATTRRWDEQQQQRPAPLPLLSMMGRTTIFWTGTFCVLFDGATVKQWGAKQLMPVAASLMILWQVQVLSKDQLAQFPSLAVSKAPFSLCCCAGNTVRVWGGKGREARGMEGRKKKRRKKKCNFSPWRCGVRSHRTRYWCTPDTRRQDPLTF